jgi:hypothetical protein
MNAARRVDELLNENGAVLVRQNKHLVYRLPNGQNFVVAKTSSDRERAAKNNLSDLRRALGVVRATPKAQGELQMPIQQGSVAVAAAVEPPNQEGLKDRLEAAIAREEGHQTRLMAESEAVERRVQMLKALLPFAADPATEVALRGVLPAVGPPPEPERRSEPPQRITERVQVTRQLVFAATQTFEGTFTVNDVLDLMTGEWKIDRPERLRVRCSIAQAMTTLHERGELIREAEGYGKRQAVWRKAALNGDGNGQGMRA